MSSTTVPYSRPVEGVTLGAMWAASSVIDEYTRHSTLVAHHRNMAAQIEAGKYVRLPLPLSGTASVTVGGSRAVIEKTVARDLFELSAFSYEPWADVSGLIGWGYHVPLDLASAVANWSATAVAVDVELSDDNAARLAEGDIFEVSDSEVMVLNAIQPKSGAAGTYTLTVERACAGTEAVAHANVRSLSLISMPSDIQYVSIVIGKRWTQTRHQPGAGAFLSEDGVPASTALIYNLRRALNPYRGVER